MFKCLDIEEQRHGTNSVFRRQRTERVFFYKRETRIRKKWEFDGFFSKKNHLILEYILFPLPRIQNTKYATERQNSRKVTVVVQVRDLHLRRFFRQPRPHQGRDAYASTGARHDVQRRGLVSPSHRHREVGRVLRFLTGAAAAAADRRSVVRRVHRPRWKQSNSENRRQRPRKLFARRVYHRFFHGLPFLPFSLRDAVGVNFRVLSGFCRPSEKKKNVFFRSVTVRVGMVLFVRPPFVSFLFCVLKRIFTPDVLCIVLGSFLKYPALASVTLGWF